jgi:beta-galactosidase
MFYGLSSAFYPEHFDAALLESNVAKMKDVGISVVRIAEFCWDILEPSAGQYDFVWLNGVFDVLGKYDMKVILCTPTAAPPLWMCRQYPEILPTKEDGTLFDFGSRRHTCPTSPRFRELCRGITEAMAEEFSQRANLIGWQVDNELGDPLCYCENCHQEFIKLLEKKFGTIDKLNEHYVTNFWAHSFNSFESIPMPDRRFNPGLQMAYRHLMSNAWVDYFKLQKDAIRKFDSKTPVTTNMMPPWHGFDHFAMARHEDVISYDMYPKSHPYGNCFELIAFFAAFYRALGNNKNFWLTEHQVGSMQQKISLPGEVQYWTWAHIALGGDLISYFRWDMPACGSERLHQAISLPSGGEFSSCQEIKDTAREILKVKDVLNNTTVPKSDVGIIFSHESWWNDMIHGFGNYSMDECPARLGNQIQFPYQYFLHYNALAANEVFPDILDVNSDFSEYKFIIAPSLNCISQPVADNLSSYVRNGGKLFLTGMPGVLDNDGRVWDKNCLLGILNTLSGIHIDNWGIAYDAIKDITINTVSGEYKFPVGDWIELCKIDDDTEVLATYEGTTLTGQPAFTRKKSGSGYCYYLASMLNKEDLPALYDFLFSGMALASPTERLDEELFLTRRICADKELIFILNTALKPKIFKPEYEYYNFLDDEILTENITLSPFEVLCLEKIN